METMKWTFRKERHKFRTDKDMYLSGENGEFMGYDKAALILGKIWSIFGDPIFGSGGLCSDFFYFYDIIAQSPEKETIGLSIYEHDIATCIGYPSGAEEAARALANLINEAQPADYEYSGKIGENFTMLTYFVKDGKEGSHSRTLTIKEIFDGNPSSEDIKMFTELGYELG